MEIAGYIASIFIGVSLGLFGAGGTILTLPILVYLFGINPYLATTYSLLVVGITSLTGTISYFKNKLINVKTSLMFAVPSIISVMITRRLILPSIPEELFKYGNTTFTRDNFILVFFSILMVFAAVSIIRNKSVGTNADDGNKKLFKVILNGVLVGIVTGSVGAGGGFLIIPALVITIGMSIKNAIGTSLLIIAINSFTGFIIDFTSAISIDYILLIKISFFAMSGTIFGKIISNKISSDKLKPVFGYFILTVAVYILFKESIL